MKNISVKFPKMELKEIGKIGKEIFGDKEQNYRHYLYQLLFKKDPITNKNRLSERFQLLCEQEAKNYDLSTKSQELVNLFSELLSILKKKGFWMINNFMRNIKSV